MIGVYRNDCSCLKDRSHFLRNDLNLLKRLQSFKKISIISKNNWSRFERLEVIFLWIRIYFFNIRCILFKNVYEDELCYIHFIVLHYALFKCGIQFLSIRLTIDFDKLTITYNEGRDANQSRNILNRVSFQHISFKNV